MDHFPPLRPDPPKPCAVCKEPHSRPKSVFCSEKCKQAFAQAAHNRHALNRNASSVFASIMQG